MDTTTAITSAVRILGGPVSAARALGLPTYQAVQHWVKTGSIPPKYCPLIERKTGGEIRCEDLCPEVDWTSLRNTQVERKAVA